MIHHKEWLHYVRWKIKKIIQRISEKKSFLTIGT